MSKPWLIISIEDDTSYQESLSYLIKNINVDNRDIKLLKASTASEGAEVISKNDDIALILLDIVMETDDAGLRLINTIRNYIGNKIVRIVIITGQPGLVPRDHVIRDYDVNEYWSKTELQGKLKSIITTNLRAWKSLKELEEANNGLMMVIEASRSISSRNNLSEFSYTILNEVSRIIKLSNNDGGIICSTAEDGEDYEIKTATGIFTALIGNKLNSISNNEVTKVFNLVLEQKHHVFSENYSGFYFLCKDNFDRDVVYIMIVSLGSELCNNYTNLLKIFAENISTGFNNLFLSNKLRDLAYLDSETQLKNRNWLEREISLMRTDEYKESKLLFFTISNHYIRHLHFGADFTKKVILEILNRIKHLFNKTSVMVRFSQETFSILYSEDIDFEMIKRNLDFQLNLNGISTFISLNILFLEINDFKDMTPNEMFKGVRSEIIDASMSHTRFHKFKPLKLENALRDLALINRLGSAIDNNEIYITLQPKMHLITNMPIGFEALIRWEDEDGNFISPALFIPAAIRSDVIQKLDLFVLKECIKAQKILNSNGWYLPISFNATVSDLKNQLYIDELFKILQLDDIDNNLLEIELLESDAMKDYYKFDTLFRKIKEFGVKIALDDFGTGYSSLQHLAKLPIDILKIDQGFIKKLDNSDTDMHIVSLVIQMGDKLGFNVIAEGIETELHKEILTNLGCIYGQGFLFSKALKLNYLLDWLKDYKDEI